MARLNDLKMSTAERRRRRFSDNFKMQKVREIKTGQTNVSEICSQYQVTSKNVYIWVDKFGSMKNKKNVWLSKPIAHIGISILLIFSCLIGLFDLQR